MAADEGGAVDAAEGRDGAEAFAERRRMREALFPRRVRQTRLHGSVEASRGQNTDLMADPRPWYALTARHRPDRSDENKNNNDDATTRSEELTQKSMVEILQLSG